MKLLKWMVYITVSILIILLDACLMKVSIQYVPIFKEIGTALGLNKLSVTECFIGILGYVVIYGVIKGISLLYELMNNILDE